MMQFFGTVVTKEDPMDLVLDEGDIFHLTHALIDPRSQGKGKVYVQAVISLMDEEEFEEEREEDSEVENEIKIPICVLEEGKTEQVSLDLHFNFEQIVRFELVGKDGCPSHVSLSGTMITMESGGCQDENCDDDQCGINHEDDEELDSDAEEFDDSMDEEFDEDEEDEEEEEEIPALIPAKNNKQQPKAKVIQVKEQPKKQISIPDKAAANKPVAKKQQPQPQQQQQSPAKPLPQQKKQQAQQQQSPAKPQQANNKKRPQQQNENNKKKQKN